MSRRAVRQVRVRQFQRREPSLHDLLKQRRQAVHAACELPADRGHEKRDRNVAVTKHEQACLHAQHFVVQFLLPRPSCDLARFLIE